MDFGELFDPSMLWIFLFLLWITYMYMTWPYGYFRKRGIPCGTPVPFFGNWTQVGRKSLHEIDREMIAKYGKIVGCFNGWVPEIIITDLDMIKQFLIKEANNFVDRRTYPLLGLVNHSLFGASGDDWKRTRSLITPFFSSGKLKLNSIRINTVLDKLINNLKEKCNGQELEAKYVSNCFAMDVICSVGFGVEVETIKNPDSPIVKHSQQLLDEFAPSNPWYLVIFFFPNIATLLAKCGVSMFSSKPINYIAEVCRKLIKQKQDGEMESQEFVAALVQAYEREMDYKAKAGQGDSKIRRGMSETEIVANAFLFLAAGYETTATTLSFLMFCLTTNPGCQDKLYEEIEQTIGTEEPTYENIQELNYLDWCVDETLRLYPAAARFDRKCTKATQIGELDIHEGMILTVPMWCLHHNPEVWSDPETFDPTRFSPEIKAGRNPLNFLPFGGGPRQCIGMRLALLEVKMAIVKILQNFQLVPNKKTVPIVLIASSILLQAKDGLWLSLKPRKQL